MTIPSGGFLRSGEAAKTDDVTRTNASLPGSTSSDGTVWNAVSGAWATNGSLFTTSTARASDPKIILFEEYSDFDFSASVGWGDALYVRWTDASNWLRVAHYQTTSSYSYPCGPTYTCYYPCPGTCLGYFPDTCYYPCPGTCANPTTYYPCSCTNNYVTAPYYATRSGCIPAGGGPGYYIYAYACTSPASCPGTPSCSPDYFNGAVYCYTTGFYCSVYTGQYCASTCANPTTYYPCTVTCSQACQTAYYYPCTVSCGYPCQDTCAGTYYPSYVRLEKMVAGTLTNISEVNINGNTSVKFNTLRVTGKGTAINVYSDYSPSTAHITATVTEGQWNRGYGVGRHGYGNQDSGNSLDNISLKVF